MTIAGMMIIRLQATEVATVSVVAITSADWDNEDDNDDNNYYNN